MRKIKLSTLEKQIRDGKVELMSVKIGLEYKYVRNVITRKVYLVYVIN